MKIVTQAMAFFSILTIVEFPSASPLWYTFSGSVTASSETLHAVGSAVSYTFLLDQAEEGYNNYSGVPSVSSDFYASAENNIDFFKTDKNPVITYF